MSWTFSSPDRGRHIFADVLARYAAQTCDGRLGAVERRVRAAVRVAVTGRQGVGPSSVAAALSGAGHMITRDVDGADVHVRVIAEALKPEDEWALRDSSVPAVVVLNKADLAGADPGGPLAGAEGAAARLAAERGLPVVPMVALLADVALGDEDMAALRALARCAADMTSTDAFVAAPHDVPGAVRSRLLVMLDRFGLAHAILAVAEGAAAGPVAQRLRELSHLDRVLDRLTAAAAPVRYHRIAAALVELRILAACSGDEQLAAFCCADDTVLAVSAAAVDVVEASGGSVAGGDGPEDHLKRALRWRSYGQGPVSPLHQRCADDIVRASLRLLDRVR